VIMYKQVKTYESVTLDNGAMCTPVASLEDEYGGKSHFIVDDHCYVLLNGGARTDGRYVMSEWIYSEAFEVLKTLPNPTEVRFELD